MVVKLCTGQCYYLTVSYQIVCGGHFFKRSIYFFRRLLVGIFFQFNLIRFGERGGVFGGIVCARSPVARRLLANVVPVCPINVAGRMGRVVFTWL